MRPARQILEYSPYAPLERVVTVSIDDGHPSDLRVADLLAELGYSATFYVPATNPERDVVGIAEIQRLAESFELGGHGYNHQPLPPLETAAARREIRDGKAWLEDALSMPVNSFCYPRGKFSHRIAELVAQAGFIGARTTVGNVVAGPEDVFRCGVTTQVFPHSRRVQARHALRERNWRGAANYARIFHLTRDWSDHFERGVSHVCRHGGVAHLWLHSWELDDHDQWSRLERLLRRLKAQYQFTCATNGELFACYSGTGSP
jgi:peptidoglycan/xylan/chitin deacetylase (PgdA/CDA1 family)